MLKWPLLHNYTADKHIPVYLFTLSHITKEHTFALRQVEEAWT